MCFSAQASFIASVILVLIGIITLKINSDNRYKALSLMPFLFGIQQFFEGVLWVSFNSNGLPFVHELSKYIFLVFAILIWPFYVPQTMLLAEEKGNNLKKKVLTNLRNFSVLWVTLAAVYMVVHTPSASAATSHIAYTVPITGFLSALAVGTYLLLTITPFFISSNIKIKLFGVLFSLTAILSYRYYSAYFTSVWCYFAAVVSSLSLLLIWSENRDE